MQGALLGENHLSLPGFKATSAVMRFPLEVFVVVRLHHFSISTALCQQKPLAMSLSWAIDVLKERATFFELRLTT